MNPVRDGLETSESDANAPRYLIGSSSSNFSISGLRLPVLWIVATIALGFLVDYAAILANAWIVPGMGRNLR